VLVDVAGAVSHIRRELHRLLRAGLVEDREIEIGGSRRAQAFQTTAEGERRLREWVATGGVDEGVVVKNPTLMRVFLSRGIPVPDVLAVIDARLRQVEEELGTVSWGRGRAAEMGLTPHEDRRFAGAVSDYVLRSLYFEQGNLRQLRDTIAQFDAAAFAQDDRHPRVSLRPREPGA
jgi:DNA-binding PadR family transcriptional regulator